ncbi:MAG: hypothetical protein AAF386_03515, partial [Pseudomonadota bacterium]
MKNLLLSICLLAFSAGAQSQTTQELAEEYANLPAVQNMMTELFSPEAMRQQMVASVPPSVPITDSQLRRIGVVMSNAMIALQPR